MKVQGHLRDYPLTDLFKILASRRESGCLRIEFEPQPALLYFNNGKLVDAQVADLRGLSAIQLACSRATAPFVFDNAILPPPATKIDENEMRLVDRVLSAAADELVTVASARHTEAKVAVTKPITPMERTTPIPPRVLQNASGSKTAASLPNETRVFASSKSEPAAEKVTPSFPVSNGRARPLQTLRPADLGLLSLVLNGFFRTLTNCLAITRQTFDYLPSRKLLRAAAAILVIAVPATVGLTLHLGKRGTAAPIVVAAKETTAAEVSSTTAGSKVENKVPSPPAAGTPGSQLSKAPAVESASSASSKPAAVETSVVPLTKTPALPVDTNRRTPTRSDSLSDEPKIIEEATAAGESSQPSRTVAENPKPTASVEKERKPESVSKTIVVVVRVEDGRVAEAWVKDSHRGSEAFEATAI